MKQPKTSPYIEINDRSKSLVGFLPKGKNPWLSHQGFLPSQQKLHCYIFYTFLMKIVVIEI